MTTLAEYHHDKDERQYSMTFPATVSTFIDPVYPSEYTEDPLPGPVANAALCILFQAVVLPLVHSVASVAIPIIGSMCITTLHPLGPLQEEHKIATSRTDVNPDPNANEKGANIKARKVRKTLIIIIKISQNYNNKSKIHAVYNLLSRPHV